MRKYTVAIGLILMAGFVGATLLVEETWNYGVGSDSSTWTGGSGFVSTAWNPNAYNPSGATMVNGLTFGNMEVSGSAVHVTMSVGTYTFGTLRRQLNTTAVTSGDLWVSYLFSYDTAMGTVPIDEALQIRTSTSLRTGVYENGDKVYFQKGSTSVASGTYAGIKNGETLLYVGKYAGMGASGVTGSTAWLLTAAGYNTMMQNGGLLEANLNAYAVVTMINNDTSLQTQAGNANLEILPLGSNSGTPSFTVDELRYGTTLVDVVAVPEPATLGLFSCMAVVILLLRRGMR